MVIHSQRSARGEYYMLVCVYIMTKKDTKWIALNLHNVRQSTRMPAQLSILLLLLDWIMGR